MTNFDQDNLTGKNHEGVNANWPVKFLTASSIIGDDIENKEGEHLGKIKDVMLNIQEGSVEYAVIEFGGFLGLGEKLFAIPLQVLKLHPGKRVFILNKKKEDLKKAPGFDRHHWPETNAHLNEINSYWGEFMQNSVGDM